MVVEATDGAVGVTVVDLSATAGPAVLYVKNETTSP